MGGGGHHACGVVALVTRLATTASTTAADALPQTALPVLVGTKFDMFTSLNREDQEEITKQAKRFSKAMHAPLVSARDATPNCMC